MKGLGGLGVSGLDLNLEALEGLSDADRRVVEKQLLELEAAFRANPLLGYRPHSKQQVFHSPPFPPLRAFFGGNRSGKTTAGVVDTIVQAVDRLLVPEHLHAFKRWEPPFYARFVTPDLSNTLEGVVLEKVREWCPSEQLRGGSFDRAWDKQLRMLRFKNGSWFQFFSNDQDRDKFGGAAIHRVVYDEEPRREIRDECVWRLIDFDGEEIFTLTPFSGMSWLFDQIYEPWEQGRLDPADGRVVVVDIDENPYLSASGRDRALKIAESNPLEREARKTGRFVSFAGLIYPEFDRQKHVVPDEDEIPEGVECFEGIDPGIRHMAAVLFCYLDSQDCLTVYDELAFQGKTVAQVCKQIMIKRTQWKVTPRWTVIDPASRNKSAQTGRSDQQEYADQGVFTIPGQNDVPSGINRVKQRLEASQGLVIARRCDETLSEFRRYRWGKNSRTEDDARERPVKKDDHLLDALRYVCMQRPLVPRERLDPEGTTATQRWLRKGLERAFGSQTRQPAGTSGPGMWA